MGLDYSLIILFSASVHTMTRRTMERPSTTLGVFGSSKFARSGATSQYDAKLSDSIALLTPFQTAPPEGYPRIVSSLLTLDYESKTCAQAYLPGKHFQVPRLPNVTVVNVLGDFDIADDKLAFIDGDGMFSVDISPTVSLKLRNSGPVEALHTS